MSPYLLFGFFMAGILSVLLSPRLVEKHLRQGDLAVGEGIAFRDSAAFVLMQRHPRVNVTI
jgi:hypothetical protein